MKSSEAKIAAATALSKIAEIRQLGLSEDYDYLASMEEVIAINAEAKRAIGIDMLNESKSINFDEFEKYEGFLERVIENNLSSPINKSLLGDEIEMLKLSSRIPLNSFREYKIEITSALVKQTVKAIGLIPNSILNIAKSSTRVDLISGEDENILALSKGTVKSKPVFFLFHLSEGPFKNKVSTSPNSFDIYTSADLEGTTKGITILSCFIINPENPLLNEQYLTPIFLQAVSCYCRNLTIGQNTKKFFYHGINSTLMIDQSGKAVLSNHFDSRMVGIYAARKTKTGYAYSFTYAVDLDLVQSNYRRSLYLS
jgi:hypothetical protein